MTRPGASSRPRIASTMDWKAGQMHLRRCAQLTGVFLLGAAAAAEPCTIMGRVSPQEIVEGAEAIVRATAIDYVVPPKDPQIRTTGVPDSTVRFAVTKVL